MNLHCLSTLCVPLLREKFDLPSTVKFVLKKTIRWIINHKEKSKLKSDFWFHIFTK